MIFTRGRELVRERMRRSSPGDGPERDIERHIARHAEAALRWLEAAQDSSPDGGVSHSYLIGKRWMRSYPETTGYIIPTMLNIGAASRAVSGVRNAATERESTIQRALQMVDFELEVQLEDGATPDLITGAPVVFDTGQVLFGLVSACQHSPEEPRYREAAQRAAHWLVDAMDADGVWRAESDAGGPGRVYNARAAWAMLEYARLSGDEKFAEPVRRFLDWTLENESSPGWFNHNCLNHDAAPLLHTIAYTARGQLECGLLLDESRYIDASQRTVDRLVATVADNGFMPGRFDAQFNGAAKWACLTGMAQTSILWRRHATLGAPATHSEAADRVNGYLMRVQDLGSSHPGMYGGIRGSFPVNGDYGKWSVLNWATKFFVDALMLQIDADYLRFPG